MLLLLRKVRKADFFGKRVWQNPPCPLALECWTAQEGKTKRKKKKEYRKKTREHVKIIITANTHPTRPSQLHLPKVM